MYNEILGFYNSIPTVVVIVIAVAMPVLWGMIGSKERVVDGPRWSRVNLLLAVVWLAMLVYGALLSRANLGLENMPWNWSAYRVDFLTEHWLREVLLNVLMMEPLGMFLANAKSFSKALICGLVVTVTLEILQPVLSLGSFEMFDILWNLAGCAIGAMSHSSRA